MSREGVLSPYLVLQFCLAHGLPELADLRVVGSLGYLLCESSLLVLTICVLHRQNKI